MLITSTANKTSNNIKKLDSLTQTNPSINKNNSVSYQEKKDIKLGLLGSKCDKEPQSLNPTPINIQKTIIKNPINSVNKTKYNSHNSTSLNKSRNISYISPAPTIFQNPKNYTTSFSSKGYGNGFISKSSRFNNTNNISLIGPGDYSPEKNISIEAEVNKSIFGKSFFIKKKSNIIENLKKARRSSSNFISTTKNTQNTGIFPHNIEFNSALENSLETLNNSKEKKDLTSYIKIFDYKANLIKQKESEFQRANRALERLKQFEKNVIQKLKIESKTCKNFYKMTFGNNRNFIDIGNKTFYNNNMNAFKNNFTNFDSVNSRNQMHNYNIFVKRKTMQTSAYKNQISDFFDNYSKVKGFQYDSTKSLLANKKKYEYAIFDNLRNKNMKIKKRLKSCSEFTKFHGFNSIDVVNMSNKEKK